MEQPRNHTAGGFSRPSSHLDVDSWMILRPPSTSGTKMKNISCPRRTRRIKSEVNHRSTGQKVFTSLIRKPGVSSLQAGVTCTNIMF